ncbi:hypothetical protein XELAEV_18037212mg [Xenopus laevis]|uniref:Uncharacterized protein n=1 Tax=Xenopus laevis TaxID=8355 RepID=A0A974CCZ6_XENLA|nr:hypothetical protein XELAEV_18037212mg [Xenopus laevis]
MPDEHKSDGNQKDRETVQSNCLLKLQSLQPKLLKGTERKGNMLHYKCTNKKNLPNILDLLYILIMRSRLAFREVMSSYKVSGYIFFEKNSPKKVSKKGRSRFFFRDSP